MMPSRNARVALLLIVAIASVLAMLVVPRIAQDPAYHEFADARAWLGVPNFLNVATNAGFLFAGVFGLWRLPRTQQSPLRSAYLLMCVGVILVGFGSAWYHLAPATATLAWDRAPMTIAFMALFALVLGDCISEHLGARLLWPLVLAGLASVAYWQISELRDAGDLRPYALVQFLPMLLMPLVLVLFGTRRLRAAMLWSALIFYALSKLAEYFDAAIYELAGFFSGHSVKHLVAAAAVLAAIMAFRAETPRATGAAGTPFLDRRGSAS